jgi:hypothetical protein
MGLIIGVRPIVDWFDMAFAPRDGTAFLAGRDNGCGWDFYSVWWSGFNQTYPWQADGNEYADGFFDCWTPLPESPQ